MSSLSRITKAASAFVAFNRGTHWKSNNSSCDCNVLVCNHDFVACDHTCGSRSIWNYRGWVRGFAQWFCECTIMHQDQARWSQFDAEWRLRTSLFNFSCPFQPTKPDSSLVLQVINYVLVDQNSQESQAICLHEFLEVLIWVLFDYFMR